MNYAAGALLLVKSIEARRDELGERRAHAEIMAALDAFDAIVADMLGALPRHVDTDSLSVRRVSVTS